MRRCANLRMKATVLGLLLLAPAAVIPAAVRAETWQVYSKDALPSGFQNMHGWYDKDSLYVDSATGYVIVHNTVTVGPYLDSRWLENILAVDCAGQRLFIVGSFRGKEPIRWPDWRTDPAKLHDLKNSTDKQGISEAALADAVCAQRTLLPSRAMD